jgi:hypothetical protein
LVLLLGSLLLLGGCASSNLPKTYPAHGIVQKGGQPMKGGSIQFIPVAEKDKDLRVVGEIKEDGTFTLSTLKDNRKTSGAPEGEYEVQILPPLERAYKDVPHAGSPPLVLPKKWKIEAKDDNEFTIDAGTARAK